MAEMAIEDETVKLLAAMAMLAGDDNLKTEARTIVSALERINPEAEDALLLKAVTEMKLGNAPEGARILRDQLLAKYPDSAQGKSMLGLALHMQGLKADRDKALEEVIAAGGDENVVKFAQSLSQE